MTDLTKHPEVMRALAVVENLFPRNKSVDPTYRHDDWTDDDQAELEHIRSESLVSVFI